MGEQTCGVTMTDGRTEGKRRILGRNDGERGGDGLRWERGHGVEATDTRTPELGVSH